MGQAQSILEILKNQVINKPQKWLN
jgi:hypothetical protein